VELRFREAAQADYRPFYDSCFLQHRANTAVQETVKHEWRVLLENEATVSMVVEDQERPEGRRIVGCGQIVFVTDQFVAWMKSFPLPNLNIQVSHPMPGGSCPLLTLPQVALANAGVGLNGVFTRWGRADGLLTEEESRGVGRYMHDSFMAVIRGYQFKELLIQAYTRPAHEQGLRAGFLDRSCADDCRARGEQCDAHSFLMGLTREEARAQEGCVMSHYFVHNRPRFGFGARQQEMLRLSCLRSDLSDEMLAETLAMSVSAVKNWWQAVYRRVSATHPDLLPPTDAVKARGPEKRRCLLQYLREHPEELRPYKPRRV